MTDYTKLVDALRDIEKTMFALGTSPINMDNVSIRLAYDKKWGRTAKDAADAIVELQQIAAHYEQSAKDYWKEACEYKAELPKRGEWIRHTEVKNIYGGEFIECPFCGEKYVVQYIADEKFCRNCGADMMAKMEVQDADK